MALLLVPAAGWLGASGNAFGAGVTVLLGVFAGGLGRYFAHQIVAVPRVNTAVKHLMRGDLAAASSVLDSIPARATKSSTVRRSIGTVRATLALYEGRLDDAVRYATAAIEVRRGLLPGAFEGPQIAAAHGLRGLAFAALGNADRAKADADAAETSVDATPEVIARARIVRAIVASRAAYHEEAFRLYLGANARLVLEHAMPRERVLFRALRRMSRSPQRSVYREQGRVDDDRAPSKLASWIAYVVPEAAAYVEGDRMLADRVDEPAIPSGVPSDVRALRTARAGARSAPSSRRWRLVLLWATLVALFLALWQLLAPAAPSTVALEAPIGPSSWTSDVMATLVPLGVGALLWVVSMALRRRRLRAFSLARRLAALGEPARAWPALVELASSSDGILAATAALELARLAMARADFAEAIARCDAAIARVSEQPLRAHASDLLLPALMTESAVAMAARGGLEDADAELAVLCRDFPSYPRLASSVLRVRLVRAIRAGDRDAACAVARSRTGDLPLPYREDVLADLALASRGEATDDDLARLDAELRDDAELRGWLDAVAPGLRDDKAMHGRRARIAASAAAATVPAIDALPERHDTHIGSMPEHGADLVETTAESATTKRVERQR